MPAATKVRHDESARQFEMPVSGGLAVLAYSRAGDRIDLLHTMVPEQDEGSGHGSALVKAAFDYARGAKLKVVPTCPFVKAYLEKHPDQRDIAVDP